MSAQMTSDENMVWQYVEDESNELVLSMLKNIEADGFDRVLSSGAETMAMKVLSAALVKFLAITIEKEGNMDLAGAYLQLVPLHVELIKIYTFRALEREIKR